LCRVLPCGQVVFAFAYSSSSRLVVSKAKEMGEGGGGGRGRRGAQTKGGKAAARPGLGHLMRAQARERPHWHLA
jgi:hypothetical protein